jgi:hypothetical protein
MDFRVYLLNRFLRLDNPALSDPVALHQDLAVHVRKRQVSRVHENHASDSGCCEIERGRTAQPADSGYEGRGILKPSLMVLGKAVQHQLPAVPFPVRMRKLFVHF